MEKETKSEEIEISEAMMMLKKFILKNKKIIITVITITVILSIVLSIRAYNSGKYTVSEVQLPFLRETKGKNFDGTKFDEKFLIAGDTRFEIEPIFIPESIERKIIFKDEKIKSEEIDFLLSKNIEIYLKTQIPPKDQMLKYTLKKENLIKYRGISQKEDEYRTRVDIFNWYMNVLENTYKKVANLYGKEVSLTLEKDILNIREEIKKYETKITTKKHYSSKEDINSYYDKIIDLKKVENNLIQLDIKVLKEIVDTFNNSNQHIPLTFKIGNRTYESILSEYTNLILKYNTNLKYIEQQNVLREKNIKEMVVPKEQEKIILEKQEEKIVNMVNAFIEKFNEPTNVAFQQKSKDAIKVSKARVESSGKPFEQLLIGIFLGVVFGCIVALLKELYEELKGKKEEEKKQIKISRKKV